MPLSILLMKMVNEQLKLPGTSNLLVTREEIEKAAEEDEAVFFELDPAQVVARPYKFDSEARKYLLSIKCPESAINML